MTTTGVYYVNLPVMWPFKSKSPKEKLEAQYKAKLKEAYQMASVNRAKSDQLVFEAEEILKKIDHA